MSDRVEPPRLLTRLLEAALPPTERHASIVGDLEEEFTERLRDGRVSARLWYAREVLGVVARYARRSRRYVRRQGIAGESRVGSLEGFVGTLHTNVRYALRRLASSPIFAIVAVVSLALGIGANTAIFSLVNATILREAPFEDPETLVDVYEESDGFSHGTLSYPDYVDFAQASDEVFEAVGGGQFAFVQADVDGGVESLLAEAVTGNYLEILGVQPYLGRLLGPEDHVARGAHPVAVLSYDYWRSRYGGDPGIVGSEIRLSGRPYTVIGVLPEEYAGFLRGLEPSLIVPIMMYDELTGTSGNFTELRGNQSFFGRGRLREDATIVQARGIADRLTETLRERHPDYWRPDKAFVLEPTGDVIMNPMIDRFIVPAAGMIMAVVGMVLLIACANLASFLLARAADRRREIAVRLAMGARRRTLIGQLLTETVLLSAVGGLAGVFVAVRALDALTRVDLPLPLPITLDLSLDGTVLGFSILVSIGAGLLFGLGPALQSTNPDVAPTLRDESTGGGQRRGAALRNLLVVGQVAVSVVLLVGAGLFLRSLDASRKVDPGFGVGPTGIMHLTLAADRYSTEEVFVYLTTLEERLREQPGVEGVGYVDNIPLNQLNTQSARVRVEGVEPPPGRDFHSVDQVEIDDGFLDVMGIEVVAGRGIEETDIAGAEPVALVNQAFAGRFFAEGDAVGRTVLINDDPYRVVGVTADHKVRSLGEAPRALVYRSLRQGSSNFVFAVARTSGSAERLTLDMISAARSIDPEIMVVQARTLRRHLSTMLLGRELGALVVGAFAALALLLASIGLYGVVSYAVARRAREVGIRLSLGADATTVIRMLTGGGVRLAAIGGGVGLVIAAAIAQLLSRLLYGVPPLDPVTFTVVPAVFLVVALLASWVPARRVARIDPVGALRAD